MTLPQWRLWTKRNAADRSGDSAREAILFLLEKEQAERPHITIVRHGLAISTRSGSIRSEAFTSIGMVRHFALEGKNPF